MIIINRLAVRGEGWGRRNSSGRRSSGEAEEISAAGEGEEGAHYIEPQ
jgi:hypothetical protein